MKNIFIITNPYKDKDGLENRVCTFLKNTGVTVNVTHQENSEIPPEAECIIVIGGDGTMVRAAKQAAGKNIPIVGINAGTLGFLTSIEPEDIEACLDQLVNEKYDIEKRMMLEGIILRNGSSDTDTEATVDNCYALNDIVVTRSQSMQIIHYHLYVNGQFLNGFDADGIIIATPTGSTGYNMSAGGPIVEPTAKLIVVTPICPHTLSTRSIILSAEDEVEIEMRSSHSVDNIHAEANFDGAVRVGLEQGDRIKVKMSTAQTHMLSFSKMSFLEAVHKKMAGR